MDGWIMNCFIFMIMGGATVYDFSESETEQITWKLSKQHCRKLDINDQI